MQCFGFAYLYKGLVGQSSAHKPLYFDLYFGILVWMAGYIGVGQSPNDVPHLSLEIRDC